MESPPPEVARILALPHNLLQQSILTLLEPCDVVAFLCTSHAARIAAADDSVWRPRCNSSTVCAASRPREWGYDTYKELYAQVVHPFGHLPGLWTVVDTCYGGILIVKPEPPALAAYAVVAQFMNGSPTMEAMWKLEPKALTSHQWPPGTSAPLGQMGQNLECSCCFGSRPLVPAHLSLMVQGQPVGSVRGVSVPGRGAGRDWGVDRGAINWPMATFSCSHKQRHMLPFTLHRLFPPGSSGGAALNALGQEHAPGGLPAMIAVAAAAIAASEGGSVAADPAGEAGSGSPAAQPARCTCNFPELDAEMQRQAAAHFMFSYIQSEMTPSAWAARGQALQQLGGLERLCTPTQHVYARIADGLWQQPDGHPLAGLWRGTYGVHGIEVVLIVVMPGHRSTGPSNHADEADEEGMEVEEQGGAGAEMSTNTDSSEYQDAWDEGEEGDLAGAGPGPSGPPAPGSATEGGVQASGHVAPGEGTTASQAAVLPPPVDKAEAAAVGELAAEEEGWMQAMAMEVVAPELAAEQEQQQQEQQQQQQGATLCVVKLVGDPNVPAGAMTLEMALDAPPPTRPSTQPGQVFRVPPGYRARVVMPGEGAGSTEQPAVPPLVVRSVHQARGQIAGHAYDDPRWTPVELITFHVQSICPLHGLRTSDASSSSSSEGTVECFGVLWHEFNSFSLFTRLPV